MIVTAGLGKDYGSLRAVDALTLTVSEGEIFGCLGPNGAGKTTTVRMLIGLLRPSRGWARVAGYDPITQSREVHRHTGVVFETPNLYERLTVSENLALPARLLGVTRKSVDEAVERFGLSEVLRRRACHLSKGWRQRVLLARAMLHRPRVLFLDEPTSGLDPNSARMIRDIIRELRSEGATVFLTTHDMHEADELCDRVGIFYRGQLAALDAPAVLKAAGKKQLVVEVRGGDGEVKRHELPFDAPDTADWLHEAMKAGVVLSVATRHHTLAEVFSQLTGGELS
ncbi:MAG: ABC transporter ATP-binding protein [Acetobacteraceae bacterium]|nr:ABC transporter ATP-binding protein [Acetobacteraceae bacterium]